MDPVHGLVDCGRCQSTVDRKKGLGGGSPGDGRDGTPVRGTSPRLRKKGGGDGGDPHRLQKGWRRGGSDRATVVKKRQRKRSMQAVLGRGE
jgi:hypothetical protein